jgi:hypothetical protein
LDELVNKREAQREGIENALKDDSHVDDGKIKQSLNDLKDRIKNRQKAFEDQLQRKINEYECKDFK